VLLAEVLQRLLEILIRHGDRRVLDGHARVGPQRDRGLDLHHRRELERRALLERHVVEVRVLDGVQLRLGQRLPVHLGNQPLGHLPAHLVGEVELQEVAGDMALPEPRQLRLPPDSPVGLLPRLADEVLRGLHLEAALAGLELFDGDFHRERVILGQNAATVKSGREAGALQARGAG